MPTHGIYDEVTGRKPPPWKSITTKAWISLAMGVLAQLVAGSNYAFSAWSDTMKTDLGYSQSQIDLVGSLGNLGQYLGLIPGIINDIYGVSINCMYGGVLQFAGYFLMYLTSKGVITALNPAGLQGVLFMIASNGSTALFLSGVSANVQCFPAEYRAMVVGLMFGVYGLCATMLTGIYNGPFNGDNLAGFQLFVSILTISVSLLAAFLLHPFDTKKNADASHEYENNLLVEKSGGSSISALRRIFVVLFEKLSSLTFFLLFISFFLGAGAGLLHINNIGQLTKALNNAATAGTAVFITVTIQSVGNGVGRISMGVTDHVHVKRGWFYIMGLVLMAVAQLLAALIFEDGNFTRVYGVTVLTGLSYGFIWSNCATIVSENWRAADFGQNWGWMTLAAAAASFAFNGTAGAIYDHEVNVQHDDPKILTPIGDDGKPLNNDCVGNVCFRNAYFFGFGMALLGTLIALLIVRKTKYGLKREGDVDYEKAYRQGSEMFSESKKPLRTSVQRADDEFVGRQPDLA